MKNGYFIEYGADIRKMIDLNGQEYSLLDLPITNLYSLDIAENLAVYLIEKGLNGKNCGKNTDFIFIFTIWKY